MPNRIVFIPVIAVLAGVSVFVAVLLICLELVPAFANEKRSGGAEIQRPESSDYRGMERGARTRDPEPEMVDRSRAAMAERERDREAAEREHREREDPGPLERVRHLREAAEHLELAGFHDEALQWAERAEKMEQEVRHRESPSQEHFEHLGRRLEEIGDVMGRMQEEIRRLNHRIDGLD